MRCSPRPSGSRASASRRQSSTDCERTTFAAWSRRTPSVRRPTRLHSLASTSSSALSGGPIIGIVNQQAFGEAAAAHDHTRRRQRARAVIVHDEESCRARRCSGKRRSEGAYGQDDARRVRQGEGCEGSPRSSIPTSNLAPRADAARTGQGRVRAHHRGHRHPRVEVVERRSRPARSRRTSRKTKYCSRRSSPGGASLLPDKDVINADLSSVVLSVSGVGEFNQITLGKKLTGKRAGVRASLEEDTQTLRGSASSKDLETMFQLAWLRMTQPRVDSSAFLAFKNQMRVGDGEPAQYPRVGVRRHHHR